MSGFKDNYNRVISYLRVSITDLCNLRCVYCMPKEGLPLKKHAEILRFEEILQLILAATELGIDKVRITGGEPLVRKGAPELVRMIRQNCLVKEICMTTNGILLGNYAQQLRKNGLDRLNISLDTLDPAKFKRMTRATASLEDVFRGINAAREAEFDRIKFNVVVIRGHNDDEIEQFVDWAVKHSYNIRFIELMPTGTGCFDHKQGFVPATEIKSRIERAGRLVPCNNQDGAAREYQLQGSNIKIGLINSVSRPFCDRCNRLRLTAAGILKPCLYSDIGIDLRPDLRGGADIETLKNRLREMVASKPKGHHIGSDNYCFAMNEVGG